ncbi:hypothetical protein [Candidatus Protochlamydia phocaeensis]|uniref:hypothetical protein n=1 Tax=Candidatus Protochlamydia phocaeensis TaxID=1414722 RepID=UPI000838C7EA|nr:hypothetical protein [Candidatus Protochlamydia phocaeensis]
MFKRKIVGLICILAALVAGSLWFFHSPSLEDHDRYLKLLEYSDSSKQQTDKKKPFTTRQQRSQVSKQIFFINDQGRLQWRLKSASSELTFGQQADSMELVEHFKNVSCLMQEKLIFSQSESQESLNLSLNQRKGKREEEGNLSASHQLIRCLQAQQAVYHYKTQELAAEDVDLARYSIPGHEWVDIFDSFKPVMKGQAQRIQLSFSPSEPSFKAQGIRATFQDWEKAF